MKVKSRKELRKEFRKTKKLKKHEFFLKRKNKQNVKNTNQKTITKECQKAEENSLRKYAAKANKLKISKKQKNKTLNLSATNSFKSPQDRIDYDRQKEKRKMEKLDEDIQKARIERLKADNEKEELEIKKLEKQMKLKNGKTSKAFVLDGLDYLLDVCNKKISSYEETFQDSDSEFENDNENEEIKMKKKKEQPIIKQCPEKQKNCKKFDKTKKNYNFFEESDDDDDDDNDDDDGDNADADVYNNVDNDENDIDDDYDDDNDNNDDNIDDDDDDDDDKDGDGSDEDDIFTDEYSVSSRSTLDDVSVSQAKNLAKKNIEKAAKSQENKKKNITFNNEANTKQKKIKFEEGKTCSGDNISNINENESNVNCINKNLKDKPNAKLWEDIYGRIRDESGGILKTYVPPHLRINAENTEDKKNENVIKLKKQLKGLLNRLAESNMMYISNQVEQLYMNNSRNTMNKTLFSLFQDSLFTKILTPERLISEHAMLIAIMHSNIGSEIGAFFLQNSVTEFVKALESHLPLSDKTENNLLIFIMHLYNFQLFHCKLLYNIIQLLMNNFEEKEIELIILTLRTVGFTLRKNDPIALKNLILKVQEKVNRIQNLENGSRVKFMLDMLMAIKNNNMSKIPNYNPELTEKLRKSLKLFIRKGNYSTELNISLDDLLNAEKNGRWWIIGSAWSGPTPQNYLENSKVTIESNNTKYSDKLLRLAKKQRMNTDHRKNIFCILMSSEDFLEAFEKLIKLKLKGSVEREIMNVLLHCTLQEKSSNPYYMYLANKFCQFDRKYQIMLQCAIWDKIKDLGNFLPNQVTILAKFVGNIILEKGLPLTVLKVVEFSELDKSTMKFMRQVLLTILLSKDHVAAIAVFKRISKSDKLKLFRESMSLFLQQFLLKNTKNIDDKDISRLTEMVNICKNALYSYDGAEF